MSRNLAIVLFALPLIFLTAGQQMADHEIPCFACSFAIAVCGAHAVILILSQTVRRAEMKVFRCVGMLLGFVSLAFGATALALPPPTFTDLGLVHNSDGSSSADITACAINASGQVTGYSRVSGGGINPGQTDAWFYNGGPLIDINYGGLDGVTATQSTGYGINDSGTIVGDATSSSFSGARAFVSNGGSMTSLDGSDSSIGQSRGYGVNSSGTVVGAAYYATNQWNPIIYNYSGAYNATTGVYSGGTWSYTNIDSVLGGATTGASTTGMAMAINNAGTVTGYAPSGASPGYYHAFVRTSDGAATDLGTLSGMNLSQGVGINANGDVAGYSSISGSFAYTAFLNVHGAGGYSGMTALAMPADCDDSQAYSVNKYDMVAGMAYLTASGNTANHAFLWTTGVVPFYGLSTGVNDLNALVASLPAASGWVLTRAKSINDSGQITGTATHNGSSGRVYPVPATMDSRRRQRGRQGGHQRPDRSC